MRVVMLPDRQDQIRELERQRIDQLERARMLIPVMDEARRAIIDRDERVTNERLADYLAEKNIPPLIGSFWYAESVARTLRIDEQHRALAGRILKAAGKDRPDARAAHDRAIADAREVATLLR